MGGAAIVPASQHGKEIALVRPTQYAVDLVENDRNLAGDCPKDPSLNKTSQILTKRSLVLQASQIQLAEQPAGNGCEQGLTGRKFVLVQKLEIDIRIGFLMIPARGQVTHCEARFPHLTAL
jgi:hypothetical protein